MSEIINEFEPDYVVLDVNDIKKLKSLAIDLVRFLDYSKLKPKEFKPAFDPIWNKILDIELKIAGDNNG